MSDVDGAPAVVELTVPATNQHLRLVRLAASGMAADLDFTLDQIDDVRLAVDEACAVLVERAAPDARLQVSFGVEDGSLVIGGRCARRADADGSLHLVVRAILDSTVDSYEVLDDDTTDIGAFRLVKHAEQ